MEKQPNYQPKGIMVTQPDTNMEKKSWNIC